MSERMAQRVALLACIDPKEGAGGVTSTSDVIDASLYDSLMFVMAIGAVTSSGAVTLTVYKGTAAAATSITSSVTSAVLTFADDNKQVIVDVDCSKEGAYRYYKGTIVENAEHLSGTGTGVCVMVFVWNIKQKFVKEMLYLLVPLVLGGFMLYFTSINISF